MRSGVRLISLFFIARAMHYAYFVIRSSSEQTKGLHQLGA